jgi:hypothetical protein
VAARAAHRVARRVSRSAVSLYASKGGLVRTSLRLLVAVSVAVAAFVLAPSGVHAKEPRNFSWDNIQVITASPGCGNEIWGSRYDANGQLLGSKRLVRAAPGFQVIPKEIDYRTGQAPRNFLIQTFDCTQKKSRLYTWNIADRGAQPRLIVDLPATDTLFDAAFDPASQNVVYLRWGPNSTMSVEMLPPTGGPNTQLWNNATSSTSITPTRLLMDTGGEFSLLGRPGSGAPAATWIRLQLNSRTPMAQGYVSATGPGSIESAATGSFKLFDSGTVYSANGSQGWLCASPGTSVVVTENRNCIGFRPVSAGLAGSKVGWSFGNIRGVGSSTSVLYWQGDGQNFVQPISLDPTGLPAMGALLPLQGGPGASGAYMIPAADLDRAIDGMKFNVPVLN